MMNRRKFLVVLGSALLAPTTAARADYVDDVVIRLRKLGYLDITVTRTLLGRTRVVGVAAWGSREVILNPRTGEILRDTIFDAKGNVISVSGSTVPGAQNSGDDGDTSGGGQGDEDEEDEEVDEEEEDDEDDDDEEEDD